MGIIGRTSNKNQTKSPEMVNYTAFKSLPVICPLFVSIHYISPNSKEDHLKRIIHMGCVRCVGQIESSTATANVFEQIQRISARLRQYGKIEGKNVFYWFQNHKA